mmetsp:Transcript_35856/g.32253  ORF Transcript_35856/g.32253 Transcript_35856/m.32253 type:complete len:86 (+) Transcript_35856:169-426(+)
MGYQDELISLAYSDSKKQSLEEILELILSKEAHYTSLLNKEEGQPLKEADSNQAESSNNAAGSKKSKKNKQKVPGLKKAKSEQPS